jgi:hypothetical protein
LNAPQAISEKIPQTGQYRSAEKQYSNESNHVGGWDRCPARI